MRRKPLLIGAGVVLAGAITFGLIWFQPWKLWVDDRVDEALPAVALAQPSPADSTPSVPAPVSSAASDLPRLLSRGNLISQEHSTSGTVSVVLQPDGSRVLAIAHLDTSNGPDVHVWLTDAPVRAGSSGWHVFDDGKHISLGTLKGNIGNQLYPIPDRADLSQLTSVSIWCDRFNVSFGAAELIAV
jgi:hypothetical protein